MTGHVSPFTISDAVAVLAAAGHPLTARQVRYAWPVPAESRLPASAPRLFTEADVMLLAVFAAHQRLCRDLGVPVWNARAALRYRETELRRALARRQPRYVVVDEYRGTATLSETADVRGGAVIDLQQVRARIVSACADYRARQLETISGEAFDVSTEHGWGLGVR